jgi:hypothetical protein
MSDDKIREAFEKSQQIPYGVVRNLETQSPSYVVIDGSPNASYHAAKRYCDDWVLWQACADSMQAEIDKVTLSLKRTAQEADKYMHQLSAAQAENAELRERLAAAHAEQEIMKESKP